MKHETDVKLHAFSGWIDPPTDLQPAVSGEITCDTAVIGGGVGGMGTTMRLAERGQDVALIEAEFLGYGSSSRNGGHISGAPGGDLRVCQHLLDRPQLGVRQVRGRHPRLPLGRVVVEECRLHGRLELPSMSSP